MKYLAEVLSCRDPASVCWYSSDGTVETVGAMRAALRARDDSEWQGRKVALGRMPSLDLFRTLVLLDGVVDCLLFLPQEQERTILDTVIADMQIDVALGEGNKANLLAIPRSQTVPDEQATLLERAKWRKTQWILPTSGTTGTPKFIRHTFETLTRRMSRRDLGDTYIWGSLYSPRRFAGLQVFLQSWIACNPLILNDDLEISADLLRQLARLGCNALSATPSMWRKLSMCRGFESLALKQITLGGEMADQPILDLLRRCFPDARITHIYASTEAGVGFAVNDGLTGFPATLLEHSTKSPAIRVDVAGHLWLSTEAGADEAPIAASPVTEGWVDSGDVFQRTGDRFFFRGRASGTINVGGNKVMPEEVEAVIKEVPGVAFVLVKGRKSPIMGSLVEAHVVTNDGVVFDEQFTRSIAAHCRSRLEAFKVPAFVKPMNRIDLNAAGKISRKDAA